MTDVFLSYKRSERAEVERLATALRGLGLDVWFDASLSAGEAFSDEIDRQVRAARVVLVCWSPQAATSQWVKAEAQIGFTKQNLISTYVAGHDGFEPPVPFNSSHVEDMRAWTQLPSARDPAWLSVLRRLGGLVARPDIAEWGALGANATIAQIEGWLVAHAKDSPLVVDAESFLRERSAVERERAAAEAAARERVERLRIEKIAAEAAAREAQERAEAGRRARDAEARAIQAERLSADALRSGLGVAAFVGFCLWLLFVGTLRYGGHRFLAYDTPWVPALFIAVVYGAIGFVGMQLFFRSRQVKRTAFVAALTFTALNVVVANLDFSRTFPYLDPTLYQLFILGSLASGAGMISAGALAAQLTRT